MKKININLKDRKSLSLILCLVLVCVFTLTIAYSALSAVLTINGNARVSAADWDIYLANPRVTNGSATTNVPEIKTSSTLEFSTTLNMPGDFYEFVVDVVNGGDIDAMIENVVKNPELTAEQAKFLKYEVSYQNGESITTKQLLAKDTTMPIKVRVEYRKDLVASDLPTGQVVLDLSLTLEYIQSDGSGSSVNNNGVYNPISINGDINDIGTIVTIGTEQFYTIGTEGSNVKLLAMYNLHVGNKVVEEHWSYEPLENPTGMQSSSAKGMICDMLGDDCTFPFIGTIEYNDYVEGEINFSNYTGSIVESIVNEYKTLLENNFGIDAVEARLITVDELINDKIGCIVENNTCLDAPSWIYSTSYWTQTAYDEKNVWAIENTGFLIDDVCHTSNYYGVRPVIVISKYDIITPQIVEFTLDNTTYQAYEGMSWFEWVNSDFNTGNYEIEDETGTSCGALIIYGDDYLNLKYSDIIETNGNYMSNTLPC